MNPGKSSESVLLTSSFSWVAAAAAATVVVVVVVSAGTTAAGGGSFSAGFGSGGGSLSDDDDEEEGPGGGSLSRASAAACVEGCWTSLLEGDGLEGGAAIVDLFYCVESCPIVSCPSVSYRASCFVVVVVVDNTSNTKPKE